MADGRSKNGGSRSGAGRKSRAEKYERPINRAEKRIVDRLPELIDAQFDLALGVTVQDVDRETGGTIVYTRPPDSKAGQYLIDRIMGKPTQHQEVTGEDGGPIQINDLARTQAEQELAAWREQMTHALSNLPSAPPM